MGFALGGIEDVAISDGSTTVVATDVHEDFDDEESDQQTGLADGQSVVSGTAQSIRLFFLSLSSTDADQLDTWDDGKTEVTATINGLDAVLHWAEPSRLFAHRRRSPAGELSGIEIQLMTHA